jgi:hypothetical protein
MSSLVAIGDAKVRYRYAVGTVDPRDEPRDRVPAPVDVEPTHPRWQRFEIGSDLHTIHSV